MDRQKFDALTRAFATGTSRRTAIKGIFGGAAAVTVAATRLDRVGAQGTPCDPQNVGSDCPLPDACTQAQCLQGVGTESYFCSYSGGCSGCDVCDTYSGTCVSECGACESCYDGTCVSDCDPCDACVGGQCVSNCTDCQECEGNPGVCVDLSDGVCCDGTWIEGGQCCNTGDCVAPDATFCSTVICENYICTNVPECPDDQQCCGLGSEGAYCAECCDNSDCYIAGPCSTCNDGWCSTPECCYDSDCPDCSFCSNGTCYGECSQSQECCHDECVEDGYCCREIGDSCGLLEVSGAWDDSPQYDCCDGLVCCENWNSQYPVCAQCCNDWDCPKGAYCHEGWCEWPDYCDHDKDCPKGTCCCKDGSCSGKCCDKPHPPKPPKPHKPHKPAPPASGGTVTTLPATGAGQESASTGMFGAAALGAAAALYAAKKLRENPEAQTEE